MTCTASDQPAQRLVDLTLDDRTYGGIMIPPRRQDERCLSQSRPAIGVRGNDPKPSVDQIGDRVRCC